MIYELSEQANNGASELVINLVENDQLPLLVFALQDSDGTLYDLSSAAVTILARARDAESGDYKINGLMTVNLDGLVEYELLATDTDTTGEYYAEIEMDFSGKKLTSQKFLIMVLERL